MNCRFFLTKILVLLLLARLAFPGSAKAQNTAEDIKLRNAYEIAKALYAVSYDTNAGHYIQRKGEILTALVWYAQEDGLNGLETRLGKYDTLKKYYNRLRNSFVEIDSIFKWNETELKDKTRELEHKSYESFNKVLRNYKDKEKTIKNTLDSIKSIRSKYWETKHRISFQKEQQGSDSGYFFPLKRISDLLGTQNASNGNRDSSVDTLRSLIDMILRHYQTDLYAHSDTDSLILAMDSLSGIKNRLDGKLDIARAELIKIKEEMRKLVETPQLRTLHDKLDKINPALPTSYEAQLIRISEPALARDAATMEQKLLIQMQGQMPALTFKMPTETEMIDALAIYLSKRVKQEAVLWFFETIRKNAQVNDMITVCFPETISLLNSGENYETPNMGSAWRYALSKDFIRLPVNVFEGEWLAKHIDGQYRGVLDDLRMANTISRLFQQKYNYYDIVRYLYLQQQRQAGNNAPGRQMVTLLYALNHELVRPDNARDSSFHMLSYEELVQMPADALIMMFELIDLRYDNLFTTLLGNIRRPLDTPQYRRLLINWIGRMQLAVRQIDQARMQNRQMLQEAAKNGKDNDFAYTFFSSWQFMKELLTTMQPDSLLFDSTDTTARRLQHQLQLSIKYVCRAQDIYEQLEKKNFSGAMTLTLDIVDSLRKHTGTGGWTTFWTDTQAEEDKLGKMRFYEKDSLRMPRMYVKQKSKVASLKRDLVSELSGQFRKANGKLDTFINADNNDTIFYPDSRNPLLYKSRDTISWKKDSLTIPVNIKRGDTLWLMMPLMAKQMPAAFFMHYYLEEAARDRRLTDDIAADVTKGVLNKKRRIAYANILQQYDYFTEQEYRTSRQTVVRFAGFLNDVSLSGDSRQLAQVIESYAMPQGSYKRKRQTWYSLDLNAYVGAYTAYEFSVTDKNIPYGREGWIYGVSAPVGISYSKTLGNNNNSLRGKGRAVKSSYNNLWRMSKSTFSVMLSVIDIGAVVSYRFSRADSVLPQQVKWEQLISPGIHLSYGLPNTPLVLTAGVAYTPQLRRMATGIASPEQYNAFRIHGGLFFDLPLFNLWEQKTIIRMQKVK